MGTAIPLISDAVASILKHSTNELFKESCQEIMQVCMIVICWYPAVVTSDHLCLKRLELMRLALVGGSMRGCGRWQKTN